MLEHEKQKGHPVLKKYSDNLYLLFESEGDAEKMFNETIFSIGICQNEGGEWGYWDYNPTTQQKIWTVVEIPESIEDLRVTHPLEIQMETDIYNTYMSLGDEAIARGMDVESKEFSDFVSQEMQKRFD